MNGVDNMLYMQSTNANDGTMTLNVTFDVGTDVNIDQVNAQNRVSQAQPNLPADVNQFGVTVKKTVEPAPAGDLALLAEGHLRRPLPRQLRDHQRQRRPLPRAGRGPGEELRHRRLRDAHLGEARQARQARPHGPRPAERRAAAEHGEPAGRIGAEPAPAGPGVHLHRPRPGPPGHRGGVRQHRRPAQSRRLDGAAQGRARIELGALTYQQSRRFNGKPAARSPSTRPPAPTPSPWPRASRRSMEELKERFPPDLDYAIALDTTLPVTEGINEIVHTLFEAMVLVILVVFLFLQSWRATLIPLIAVPVSLIGTFVVFPLLGFSINTLSLLRPGARHRPRGGRRDRGGGGGASTTSSTGSRPGRHAEGDEGGLGPGRRHRPGAVLGVHPGRPSWAGSRAG